MNILTHHLWLKHTSIKKLDLQPQRQSITCLQITDTYNKEEDRKSNINQISAPQSTGVDSKTAINHSLFVSNIQETGKETTILKISNSPPSTMGTNLPEYQKQPEFKRNFQITNRLVTSPKTQKKELQSMEINRTLPNSTTSIRTHFKETSGNVSQTTSLQEQKQSHQITNQRTTANHFEENPITSTAISIGACQNSPTSQNQFTTIPQSKHQNPNIKYEQYQTTLQGQYRQHHNQFNHPLSTTIQREQYQPERIYMERNRIRNMAEKDYQQRRARSHSRTIQTRQPDQSSHFSRNTSRKPTGLERLLQHARSLSKSSNQGKKYSTLPRPMEETKVWIQKHANPSERLQIKSINHYHQPFPMHPPLPVSQQMGNEMIYQTLPIHHQQEMFYCSPREITLMRKKNNQREEIYMRTPPINGPIMKRRVEEEMDNCYMKEIHLNQNNQSTPSLIYLRNHQYPKIQHHANGQLINGAEKIYQKSCVQLRSPSIGRVMMEGMKANGTIVNLNPSKEGIIYGNREQFVKGYWENPLQKHHHME